jgi:hypothetical protein
MQADHTRAAKKLALMLMLLVSASLTLAPRVVLNTAHHDYFIPMDGGWRIALGQIPHQDFHTPIGALWYGWLGLFELLAGPDPRIVPWSTVAAALLIAAAAWRLVWRRFEWPIAFCVLMCIFVIAVSPRSTDMLRYGGTQWLATYNRLSWALLSLVAVALLVLPRGQEAPKYDGIIVGLCTGALLWMKATYGVAALAAILGTMILMPELRPMLKAALLATLPWLLLLATPLGRGYIADIRDAAQYAPLLARLTDVDGSNGLMGGRAAIFTKNWMALTLIAVQLVVLAWNRTGMRQLLLLAGWTLGTILLSIQNNDRSAPLLLIILICALAPLTRKALYPYWKAAAVIAVLAVPMAAEGYAFLWAAMQSYAGFPRASWISADDSGRLIVDGYYDSPVRSPAYERAVAGEDVSPDDDDRGVSNSDGMDSVHRGLELLKPLMADKPVIASLSFSNPFPFLLRLEPPRGVAQWLDFRRTWSPAHPDITRLIGNANVVMEPKYGYDWPTQSHPVIAAMRPILRKDWTLVTETPLWRVWKKREAP